MATGIRLSTITTTLSLARSPRLRKVNTLSKRQYKIKARFAFYCYFIVANNLVLIFGAMKD